MHFSWSTLLLQTVNFAVLVWLLRRFLYKPVLRMVDARRAEIDKQYADAKAVEAEAAAHLGDIEAKRAGIAAEREQVLKAAAAQAEEAAKARHDRAERETATFLDDARKTLAAEREQALAEARRSALDLGAAVATRLLSEIPLALRAEAWIERIEQHLAGLPPAERNGLLGQFADGAPLTVVSAAPFPPETAELWRNRLKRSFGDHVGVAFEADPALVAGVELHLPTAILRFSFASALDSLRAEIEADDKPR